MGSRGWGPKVPALGRGPKRPRDQLRLPLGRYFSANAASHAEGRGPREGWLEDAIKIEEERPEAPTGATFLARMQHIPELNTKGMWPAQISAVNNLEASIKDGKPRALIQMATGSGKTYTAVSSIYRLIKFGGARRVLFLVDRGNLGKQAHKEFQAYTTPDDGRKFTELYNATRL